MTDDRDPLTQVSFDARAVAWSQWGALDHDVLAPLINPFFMGGPRWPGMRQAFRVARSPTGVLVASDGLSDPFDADEGPQDVNGLGIECFAFTADPIERVAGSWLFSMVWQVSQFAAERGDLAHLLERHGLVTTEVHDVPIPEGFAPRFVNDAGRVGVLLGLGASPVPPTVAGPLSPIRLASVTLLTLAELALVAERLEEGRQEVASRVGSAASSLVRASVV